MGPSLESTPCYMYTILLVTLTKDYYYFLKQNYCIKHNLCSNMGLINKVDMVCLSPVGYGV